MNETCVNEDDHWWKAMGAFSSAYFIDVNRDYMRWEIIECKLCGEHKTVLLDPIITLENECTKYL